MPHRPHDAERKEHQSDRPEQREDLVAGRNAVLELLRSDKDIEQIFIFRGMDKSGGNTSSNSVGKIIAMARERAVTVKEVSRDKLDFLVPGVPHQGVVGQLSGARYCELADIFEHMKSKGDTTPFIVLCDSITDPHNLGAIIRSAEGAGAHGVIIPKRRSAGLSYVVSKASAGAIEHIPVVRVSNLVDTMTQLKKDHNIWFYAADMDGKLWCEQDYSGGVGLIIGAEGMGVGRLIKEQSDFVVSLPMRGKVESLNASVAAGIVLYEVARQRLGLAPFLP